MFDNLCQNSYYMNVEKKIVDTTGNKRTQVCNNIVKYRNSMGISQKLLAKKSKINPDYISRLESGALNNPTVKTLDKIASALKIRVEELLIGPEDAPDRQRRLKSLEKRLDVMDKKLDHILDLLK